MNIKDLYHLYKDNLVDFTLPDDVGFIKKCARRYIINQIKNRIRVENYRKTAKGKATSMIASRKYYRKKKNQKDASKKAKLIVAEKLNNLKK